jgi:hypothetical protein
MGFFVVGAVGVEATISPARMEFQTATKSMLAGGSSRFRGLRPPVTANVRHRTLRRVQVRPQEISCPRSWSAPEHAVLGSGQAGNPAPTGGLSLHCGVPKRRARRGGFRLGEDVLSLSVAHDLPARACEPL